MEFTTEKLQGDILIVHVQADHINACNAQDFEHSVMSLMDARYHVVLDIEPVRSVDGCGFGALMACLRNINNLCGELALCSLSGSLGSLFTLMRMHHVFNIYSSCDEAVNAYS